MLETLSTADILYNFFILNSLFESRGEIDLSLSKVFEPFQQVGSILTDKPKGTGLGLSISKQIIEQHGGRIWFSSELGKGSTFFVSLPLVSED